MTDYSNIFDLLNSDEHHELGKQLLKGLSYDERVECMCQVYDRIVRGDTVSITKTEIHDFSFVIKVFNCQIKCYGLSEVLERDDYGKLFFKLTNLWIVNTLPNHKYDSYTPYIDETYVIQSFFSKMNDELIEYLTTFIE